MASCLEIDDNGGVESLDDDVVAAVDPERWYHGSKERTSRRVYA